MLDGLRPDTCVIVIDNIQWSVPAYEDVYVVDGNAQSFDLIQYGCDGDRRVLLSSERIAASDGQVGVSRPVLDELEARVNQMLRARGHCTCR